MQLSILIVQVSDILHLLIEVSRVLITKQAVESLELIETKNAVFIEVRSFEDVKHVLELFGLKLVGCVDGKLSKVIKLHSIVDLIQMKVLFSMFSWYLH